MLTDKLRIDREATQGVIVTPLERLLSADDFWTLPIGVRPETRNDHRYDEGPMNFDRGAAIADGGVLCYAHPYGALNADEDIEVIADPKRGLVAREFPVDLALGMRCAIDLLTTEGDRNQLERKLRDIYRQYDFGLSSQLGMYG